MFLDTVLWLYQIPSLHRKISSLRVPFWTSHCVWINPLRWGSRSPGINILSLTLSTESPEKLQNYLNYNFRKSCRRSCIIYELFVIDNNKQKKHVRRDQYILSREFPNFQCFTGELVYEDKRIWTMYPQFHTSSGSRVGETFLRKPSLDMWVEPVTPSRGIEKTVSQLYNTLSLDFKTGEVSDDPERQISLYFV